MKKTAGFSLIELMVAMVIGLIVLVGVTWAYLGNRETYVINEEMARMHESARIALDVLRNRLRLAGSFGCLRFKSVDGKSYSPEADNLKVLKETDLVLKGIQDRIVNFPPFVFNSNGFGIYGALAEGMGQVDGEEVTANKIKVAGGISGHKLEAFAKGSSATDLENPYLVIGDCDKAVLFKATAVEIPEDFTKLGDIVADGDFSNVGVVFGRGAQIWGINVSDPAAGTSTDLIAGESFKRKDSGRKDLIGNPIYSLFYNGQELVEGVDDFRVCVGGGDNVALQNIESLSDDALKKLQVTQVEVDLVLSSIRPRVLPENTKVDIRLCDAPDTPWIQPELKSGGATEQPADRRLRRLFTASVALRSKLDQVGKEKEN
ncbi:MAG: prepilin-type N-terminal cleavage/methylation domain-containing protein [Zoogloeaceae bacterium]|nr:prepilin-type N-terminal cleavage/methylation domain-containing protein [Zoogloeaceae bacterium]